MAAFAHAPTGRLRLVQTVVGLLAAFAVSWFFATAWFPVISRAIHELPAGGVIQGGALRWPVEEPKLLAEGRFLAVGVDLDHAGTARSPAHLQVEFGRNGIKLFSLLGYLDIGYPGWTVSFNRTELEPWWGAWSPPILAMIFGGTLLGLFLSWSLLASFYAVPAWVIGYFADRDLDYPASWKLAAAALMPGALFMSVCVVLYGLGAFELPRLAMAMAVHLVIGWGYAVFSPFFVPRSAAAGQSLRQNPFHSNTSDH